MNILDKIDSLLESWQINEAIEELDNFYDIEKLCPKATKAQVELYRGMKDVSRMRFGKMDIRKDRRPKDTSSRLHELLNNGFKSVFGTYVRSECMFCSGFIGSTRLYGDTYKVYPSDDFTVYWSPYIEDFVDILPRDVAKLANSDSLKAFFLIYSLIRTKDNTQNDFNSFVKGLNVDKLLESSFNMTAKEVLDNWTKLSFIKDLVEDVIDKYPNCGTDFVKTFYKKGNTVQDLLAAQKSENEIMITGSFYCFEKVDY